MTDREKLLLNSTAFAPEAIRYIFLYIFYIFCGLVCVGRSFCSFSIFRDVWIRTQWADVASRRATNFEVIHSGPHQKTAEFQQCPNLLTQFSRKQAQNWVYKFGHRSLFLRLSARSFSFSATLQSAKLSQSCRRSRILHILWTFIFFSNFLVLARNEHTCSLEKRWPVCWWMQ